jgi:hypothetical protein
MDKQSLLKKEKNQQSGDFKDRWLIKAELVGIGGLQRY